MLNFVLKQCLSAKIYLSSAGFRMKSGLYWASHAPNEAHMAKMTMKKWEKSAADRKADKSGAHGKEGSAKDRAADRKAVAKANKKRK